MRLISFSYPQIGCIQSMAGVYAYIVCLNAWGVHYYHLLTLDSFLLFDANSNVGRQNDAFFLYCLTEDSTVRKMVMDHPRSSSWCVYMPEFGRCEKKHSGKPGMGCRDDLEKWALEEGKLWWEHEWSMPYREGFIVKDGCGVDNALDKKWDEVFTADNPPCYKEWAWYYKTLWKERTKEANYETRPVNRGDLRLMWRDGHEAAERIFIYVDDDDKDTLVNEGLKADAVEDVDAKYTGDDEIGGAWVPYCNKRNMNEFQMSCEDSGGDADLTQQAVGKNYQMFPMTMNDRADILARSNTAYFISIIIVQWADLMICKTRIKSLFTQGMTNIFMNWALLFETALGGFLVYSPVANTVTGTRSIKFLWWLPAIPFAIWIYTYDELRKAWIRNYRHGWVENTTYW